MLEKLIFPQDEWAYAKPEDVNLSKEVLDKLCCLVQGRGCVVRHGHMAFTWGDQGASSDIASASKPVLSQLLMLAVQEGLLTSPDDNVSAFEPGLNSINNGKDSLITWRQLASQTSGYGLIEAPGEAYSYNDFAIALYYDTLTKKVFGLDGTELFKKYFASPLKFQDSFTYEAFGAKDRPGRLAVSVRDFARIGLYCLREGKWMGKQLLNKELFNMTIMNPIPAQTPFSSRKEAEMLPGQRSMGGGKWISAIGPGYYSFNWWTNGTDIRNRRQWEGAPPDVYCASGHFGKRVLFIIPSADMVVSWNNTIIDDQDNCPSDSDCQMNHAIRLIISSIKI